MGVHGLRSRQSQMLRVSVRRMVAQRFVRVTCCNGRTSLYRSENNASARRRARGAVLAKGAGLVPGLRLRSDCQLPRDVRILASDSSPGDCPKAVLDCAASKVALGASSPIRRVVGHRLQSADSGPSLGRGRIRCKRRPPTDEEQAATRVTMLSGVLV
jgi:hypothetical protein